MRDAEIYGLKPAQVVLPLSHHRLSFLSNIKDRYNNEAAFYNENDTSSIGAVGALGFVILVGRLFYRKARIAGPGIADGLTVINLAALALGTVGCAGSVLSLLVSPEIRAYNRISVYIAFVSLMMVALLLDKFMRWAEARQRTRAAYAFVSLIVLLGLADQTSDAFDVSQSHDQTFWSDRRFACAIESAVPENSMVFQLPYLAFPEGGSINGMSDYSHLRGYLHSHTIRWSYGAMKGREWDRWQRVVTKRNVEDMTKKLTFSGFSGIYICRAAYADRGAKIEAELRSLVNEAPLVSDDEEFSFFSLGKYTERLRQSYTPTEWAGHTYKALRPVTWRWTGFHNMEKHGADSWRWCGPDGTITFSNPRDVPCTLQIRMTCLTGQHDMSDLILEGIANQKLRINNEGQAVTIAADIPPGKSELRFTCTARRIQSSEEARHLVFQIRNVVFRHGD